MDKIPRIASMRGLRVTEGRKTKKELREEALYNRRNVLARLVGLGAVAATAGANALLLPREGRAHLAETLETLSPEVLESVDGGLEAFKDSPRFLSHLLQHINRYTSELPATLENARKKALNDVQGRSRIDYIREESFKDIPEDKLPQDVRRELATYIVGLPAVESRYDNSRVSHQGAVSLVQAMPNTHEETFGYTREEMRQLSVQTEFLGRYFKDAYRRLTKETAAELATIKQRYFPGDDTAFVRTFLVPALINSYQAGPGNLQKLFRWFAAEPKQDGLKEYDVFAYMTDTAFERSINADYGEESVAYAKQVMAFAVLINSSDTSALG